MRRNKEEENILEVKNLSKSYGEFKLKNVNLKLPKGMIMGLIGENGARQNYNIKIYFKFNNSR